MYQASIPFRGPGNFLGLAGLGYRFPKVTESTDLTDFYLKDSPLTLSASTYPTLRPASEPLHPRLRDEVSGSVCILNSKGGAP